jgi:hypothetical protein
MTAALQSSLLSNRAPACLGRVAVPFGGKGVEQAVPLNAKVGG